MNLFLRPENMTKVNKSFSVNVSVAFRTRFGSLTKSEVFQFDGLYTRMGSEPLQFNILLTFCHRKIVGCDFQYNYKLNNTDLMTLKLDNVDIFQCASECLDDESCQNGWVHFSGNNEVRSTTQIDELLLL